jgi:hypothetical protein
MPKRINKFASWSYALPRLHETRPGETVLEDAGLYIKRDIGGIRWGLGYLLASILPFPFRLLVHLWSNIGMSDVIITLTHVVEAPANLVVGPYVAWADSMRYADELAGTEPAFWQSGLAFVAGVCTFPFTLLYSLASVAAAVVINIVGGLAADVANLFEADLNSYESARGIFA